MQLSKLAGLALLALFLAPPCMAEIDASDGNSDYSECAVLASVATPVLLGVSATGLAVGTGHQLVRLVDFSGEVLSELTCDGIDIISKAGDDSAPKVTVAKKVIPLVVRKDYLQLNEKVNCK